MPAWDNTAPVAKAFFTAPDNTAPGAQDLSDPPTISEAEPIGTPPNPLLIMPASFTPAFVELTGVPTALDQLSVNAEDEGTVLMGTVGGRLKNYQVRAGDDAQALPGIVHPLNHDAVTNPWVFVQL